MAVLGLRFCARAFSSCGKRGPLFIAVRGPLTIAASLVVEHRLQTRRLSNCGSRAVAPRHVASSQTRARTRVPCIGRQILNHCATWEAPNSIFNTNSIFNINSVFNTVSIFKYVAQVKPFLAVCLTPQDADHIHGQLERRVRRNPFGGVTMGKK